jgi:PEP-CTERM motif
MKSYAKALVFAAAAMGATAANATINVSAIAGCTTYCGATPITYDFNSLAGTPSHSGGLVVGPGTTQNAFAQPIGSSGQYFSVGPSTNTPGTILLGTVGPLVSLSFIWGSIDTYNSLHFTDAAGNLLVGSQYNFTGSQIAAMVPAPANGSQNLNPQNPIVTFLFSGLDQTLVGGFQMSSSQNAFEIDDIAVNAVPEPSTWAMMLLGFGAIGFAMRRRKSPRALTQLA